MRQPALLREWIAAAPPERRAHPIILDEVQKVPEILDEVHYLIESHRYSFIMSGSSACKLKRGQANLLGGRAWRMELYPLVTAEVPDFDLIRALRNGLLPPHYLQAQPQRAMRAYVDDYLKEEIAAEALTRNLRSFARFMDLLGIQNAEIVNYTKIASEVGVDAKTVKGYFEILVDTLIGRFLEPLPERPGSRKGLVSTPKFYLCDPGLARFLRRTDIGEVKGPEAGHLFETFLANEIFAANAYLDRHWPVHFYRTHSGTEVDFVINGGAVAIEAKLSANVRSEDLRPMYSFLADHPGCRGVVVSNEDQPRRVEREGKPGVDIVPWREFCRELWAGTVF
jgi:predicted AAA+ superfamily ATPase